MNKNLLCAAGALAALTLILLGRGAVQAAGPDSAPVPDAACRACHDQRNLDMNLAGGAALEVYVNPAVFSASVHGQFQCATCHQSNIAFPHQPVNTDLRQFRIDQDKACRTCHMPQAADMRTSIHSNTEPGDAGLCIDCHGAHAVTKATTASYRISSVALCEKCHQDAGLMDKYGVSTKVVSTYLQDFHGKTEYLAKAQSGAQLDQAVCTDCHGVHNIQKVDSPNSTVIQANLTATCARCHPGASANFPAAWLSHKEPSLTESPGVFLARWFYRIMIPFIVLGLLGHIVLDIRHARRQKETKHETA